MSVDTARRRRSLAAPMLGLLVAGCGSPGASGSASTATDITPRGGTLRVSAPQMVVFPPPQGNGLADAILDPQESYPTESLEVLRCCLGRTLLTHRGTTTDKGGADLLPDLATGLPSVSADGLTWTFHMRSGLRYGPPLQAVEITAPDIVRALQRTGRLMQTLPVYSIIVGFDAYANSKADSISGLETPDAHTLVVHLSSPAGDLGERFALPMVAPIPPLPGHPEAAFGIATGHDSGDSPFLVSSGPYMIDGIDKVDFTKPASAQVGASGYAAGKSYTLVRNPSWSQSVDSLRPAYVDRIVITPGGDPDTDAKGIDTGQFDLVMLGGAAVQAPLDQVLAYQKDPGKGHVEIDANDSVRSMTLNPAVPPFDDVHVRRAVNFAIDRAHILEVVGGSLYASVFGHIAIDSLEQDTLVTYSPFRGPSGHGDLDAAKREMALSKYSTAHDGLCDADVCKHIFGLGRPQFEKVNAAIVSDLARLGIGVDVMQEASPNDFFRSLLDPTQHVAAGMIVGWVKSYFSAGDFFIGQFGGGSNVGQGGNMLLGATPEQLRGWGYTVTSVPGIDDRIAQCLGLIGGDGLRCWTALDQYVTEKIAPAVPLIAEHQVTVVPKRVVRFSLDQAWIFPALDQIALAR